MVWLRWLLIFFKNFPQHEIITGEKVSPHIVFYKTGHCLYFSNPHGLTAEDKRLLDAKKGRLLRGVVIPNEAPTDKFLLPMSERDSVVKKSP